MTDFYPTWKLGECRGHKVSESMEAGGTIAAGDVVSISGVNANGQPKCIKAGTGRSVGVATTKAKSGEFIEVITQGYVKVNFKARGSANGAAGDWVRTRDGKVDPTGTAGYLGYMLAAVADGAAEHQTVIYVRSNA